LSGNDLSEYLISERKNELKYRNFNRNNDENKNPLNQSSSTRFSRHHRHKSVSAARNLKSISQLGRLEDVQLDEVSYVYNSPFNKKKNLVTN
jgi:hypothetical protein